MNFEQQCLQSVLLLQHPGDADAIAACESIEALTTYALNRLDHKELDALQLFFARRLLAGNEIYPRDVEVAEFDSSLSLPNLKNQQLPSRSVMSSNLASERVSVRERFREKISRLKNREKASLLGVPSNENDPVAGLLTAYRPLVESVYSFEHRFNNKNHVLPNDLKSYLKLLLEKNAALQVVEGLAAQRTLESEEFKVLRVNFYAYKVGLDVKGILSCGSILQRAETLLKSVDPSTVQLITPEIFSELLESKKLGSAEELG